MKVICCSCGVHLGDKLSAISDDDVVSHGLCNSCAHHFKAEIGMPLQEYLEGIPAPIVTWGEDGIIGAANKEALKLLGKSTSELIGFKGGDVFECKYAILPGGCGQSIHCSGCTIRKTATDTMLTGKPHKMIPAILERVSDAGSNRIGMFISTEKKGGVVFLTIDVINNTTPSKELEATR